MSITPILDFSPTWDSTLSLDLGVQVDRLTDGHKQIVGRASPAPIPEEWTVSFSLPTARAIDLIETLDILGAERPFRWRPSPEFPLKTYRCRSKSLVADSPLVSKVDAVFVGDPSLECEEFRDEIDAAVLTSHLELAINWASTYTRAAKPFFVNPQGVSVNSFHDVLGRGGYLPPSTGTTEGQAVIIRSLLLARATQISQAAKTQALNLVNLMASALEPIFYRGQSVPANPTAQIWLAHWVINARDPFTSKGAQPDNNFLSFGHFDVAVTFVNGVGAVAGTRGTQLADVYSVRLAPAKLLWKNVYAPVIFGVEMPVEYWVSNLQLLGQRYRFNPRYQEPGDFAPTTTSEPAGRIKLAGAYANYNGVGLVTMSAYDGAVIAINQPFDATPMWRPLV